jgi:methyl coenzyme M reductase alpha subunit
MTDVDRSRLLLALRLGLSYIRSYIILAAEEDHDEIEAARAHAKIIETAIASILPATNLNPLQIPPPSATKEPTP